MVLLPMCTSSRVLLCLLLSPCVAWNTLPRGAALRPLIARVAASRSLCPIAADSTAGRLRQQLPLERRLAEKLANVLIPLTRLLAFARLLIDRALCSLRRVWAERSSQIIVAPLDMVELDTARSLGNMLLVTGTASRAVPPMDAALAFFGYSSSPFYSRLPPESVPAVQTDMPSSATSPTTVSWLQHRRATLRRSKSQRTLDEGRLLLLRELHNEAIAQERLERGAARWFFPWDTSSSSTRP